MRVSKELNGALKKRKSKNEGPKVVEWSPEKAEKQK
jgi:hypothetical protein